MPYMARMEFQLGDVTQFILSAYPLLMSVFACMDGAVEYSALYLDHISPPVLNMAFYTVLRQSALTACRLGFNEIFPHCRLFV